MASEKNILVKVKFYYEGNLAFLKDLLSNPKYDKYESGFGKFTITILEKMKETIRVIEVIATIEEDMKKMKILFRSYNDLNKSSTNRS